MSTTPHLDALYAADNADGAYDSPDEANTPPPGTPTLGGMTDEQAAEFESWLEGTIEGFGEDGPDDDWAMDPALGGSAADALADSVAEEAVAYSEAAEGDA